MFGPTHRLLKIFQLVLLALVFYFLARLEFYLWNAAHYRDKSTTDIVLSFIIGTRFDISAIMSLLVLPLLVTFIPWPASFEKLWRSLVWLLFVLLQIPLMAFNLVDTEFINFVGRRFSFDSLFIVSEVPGKFTNFLVSYWVLFLVNIILLLMFSFGSYLVLFHKNKQTRGEVSGPSNAKLWLAHAFLCFVSAILFVVGIRGGLQSKPLNFVNANIFAAPVLNNLVLNSSFTFITSFNEDKLKKEKYFSDAEMLTYLNGAFKKASLMEGHRFAQKQNVVILILESFGAEYVGPYKGQSFTPFLDELATKSLVFSNAYANGRRSIEGVAAVIAGVPAMMNEPFISSHFMSNYFLGMGSFLGQAGYHTSFFHGANNGSMYFDSFMKSAGIENYYGAHEFPDQSQHDQVWGIWDEPFFQFMNDRLKTFPQPFLAAAFSLTSHQPYKIPAQYNNIFPTGELPILKCVAYTDFALKRFFEEAAKQPWFENTLFVITADHTATHYRAEYSNDVGDYRIPMLFYHPRMKWPTVDTTQVVQQIDILPSVLDFLGMPKKEQNFLGSSVFIPGDKTATVFIDGRYLLFAKDNFVKLDIGAQHVKMFAQSDSSEKRLLVTSLDRQAQLEKRLKASIQYFSEGMWDNKIYYPSVR